MLGRVGADSFGNALKANLADVGVDVRPVLETAAEATGVAFIHVDEAGQNSITVAPGANGVLSPDDIDSQTWAFEDARCVLLQLEIPIETVAEGLREARGRGAIGILDPAPARALAKEILQLVDIATPNENEACVLAGVPPKRVNPTDAVALGNRIRELGVRSVIVKLGDQGCVYCGRGSNIRVAPVPGAGRGFHRGGRHVQRRAGSGTGGRRGGGRRPAVCERGGGDFGDSGGRSERRHRAGMRLPRYFQTGRSAVGIGKFVDFRYGGNLFDGNLMPGKLGIGGALLVPAAENIFRKLGRSPLIAGA